MSEEVERDERHQQPVSLWSRQLSLGQVHRVEDADYSKNLSNIACKENHILKKLLNFITIFKKIF